jgi:hypothetical protein
MVDKVINPWRIIPDPSQFHLITNSSQKLLFQMLVQIPEILSTKQHPFRGNTSAKTSPLVPT